MKPQPFDLAIVGAGPAGSTCACSAIAAGTGLQVALIDVAAFPRDKSCGDAVRDDAASILNELGLSSIFSGRPQIEGIHSSFPKKFRFMEKLIDLSGHSYYIVERKLFDNAIYQAAVDRGVHDFTGHALIDAAFNEDVLLWDLILNNHSGSAFALQAKALIGADGAGSRVRRITGLKLNKDKHMAVGIRAYARAAGMDQSALRFDYPVHLIPGYGWTFPLLDHKVNIGVGLDRRDFKAIGKTLHSHLQDYVDYLADIGIIIKDVRGFSTHPLPLAYPELPLVPQRQVALIGDAANMIDPFTGEGIHYGIWAGFELGRMVSEGWQQHTIQFAMERYAKTYADKFSGTMDDAQTLRTNARFFRMFC